MEAMETTSLLGIFAFSFVLAIGAVMSPGPVSTAIVSQAPRLGWKVGPLISVGHAFLEFLIVIALAFGFQSFLAQSNIESAISFAGGTLLMWMGISLIRVVASGRMQLPKALSASIPLERSTIIRLGILATLANPFWYAWWIAVPPSYLAQASSIGLLPLGAFYLGHISADFLWNSFLASAISSGRRWMNNRTYAILLGASALFFVYLGITFLLRGWSIVQS